MLRKYAPLVILAVILVLASACNPAPQVAGNQSYTLDPLFAELYEKNGGEYFLGPIRSGRYERDGAQCQSALNRILCYDAGAPLEKRYFLLLPSGQKDYAQPFERVLARLGGPRVFGLPTEPPRSDKGIVSQAYQTMIIAAPADNLKAIRFLPVLEDSSRVKTAMVRQKYGRAEKVVFYPIQGDFGYHVPIFFDEFIARHGGIEFSGHPISEPVSILSGGVAAARQCFENYCLEYLKGFAPEKAVRLVQLKGIGLPAAHRSDEPAPYLQAYSLIFAISSPSIHSDQAQTIIYKVSNRIDASMIVNIPIRVEVTLPTGESYTYDAPATNEDGMGEVIIPPVSGVRHGMQVTCTVCILNEIGGKVCRSDVYLIWDY